MNQQAVLSLGNSSVASHTCAIFSYATALIKCWGDNVGGELGLGLAGDAYSYIGVGFPNSQMGENLPFVDIVGTSSLSLEALSLGNMQTCVILSGGLVKCWGFNEAGQLGLNDTASHGSGPGQMGNSLPFVALGTGVYAKAISVGNGFACIISTSNLVKCWGINLYGQLGLGDSNVRGASPSDMGNNLPFVNLGTGVSAISIALGFAQTCALLNNNRVKCWGEIPEYILFEGEREYERHVNENLGSLPSQMGDNLPYLSFISESENVQFISAGDQCTFIILDNGQAIASGIQYGATNVTSDSNYILPTDDSVGNIIRIYGGAKYACALFQNEQVKCWGDSRNVGLEGLNISSSLPNNLGDSLPFVNLGTGLEVEQLVVGFNHTCVLLSGGLVKCWGNNYFTGYGYSSGISLSGIYAGDEIRGDYPGEMSDDLPFVNLTGVFTFQPTVAPTTFTRNSSMPSPIETIVSGDASTCILVENLGVKCWGEGEGGQLGYGDANDRGVNPTDMGENLPFIDLGTNFEELSSIMTNEGRTCAISKITSQLKCWGQYLYYSTQSIVDHPVHYRHLIIFGGGGGGGSKRSPIPGLGNAPNQMGDNLPVIQLGTNRTVLKVDSAGRSLCTLLDNFKVKCWGQDFSDAGTGLTASQMGDELPYVDFLEGSEPIKDIACGTNHICALLNNGTVSYFEIGNNAIIVNLGAGVIVTQLTAGDEFSCFLTSTGRVKCLGGYSSLGQLGIGNTTSIGFDQGATQPFVNLGTGVLAVQISSGYAYSCAILNNQKLKCWGDNTFGQLGYGDTISRGGNEYDMGDNLTYVNINNFGHYPISVSCGTENACVLLENRIPLCWGSSSSGQLGLNFEPTAFITGKSLYAAYSIFWSGQIEEESAEYFNLNSLYASNLNLSGPIPASFGSIAGLINLDLSNNALTSIPKELSNITSLTSLKLGNNDFGCDCELLLWFRSWALNILKDWSETICNDDNSYSGLQIASTGNDPSAPCYEPLNVTVSFVNSTGATLTWTYDWATYLPYDMNYDIDCYFSGSNTVLFTEQVPWDLYQPDTNIYNLTTKLNPYTNYSCIVYPVYLFFDAIIAIDGENPANIGEANAYIPQFRTARRVRGPGSNPCQITTNSDIPDGPPINLGLSSSGMIQLALQWDPPTMPNCNLNTLSYTIEIEDVGNFTTTNLALVVSAGINPGTTYFVRTKAFNQYGSSNYSPYAEFTTEEECNAGQYYDSTIASCTICPDGTYRNESEPVDTCKSCDGLLHEPNVEKTNCVPCPPGWIVDPTSTLKSCKPCPVNTYQNGDQCSNCLAPYGFTIGQGSSSIADCVAGAGYFVEAGELLPVACPIGTNCLDKVGLTVATLDILPGYWRAFNGTPNVLQCRNATYCQPPGQNGRLLSSSSETPEGDQYCSTGHTGVLCESCVEGEVLLSAQNGFQCGVCEDDDYGQERTVLASLIILVPGIFIFVLCLVIHFTASLEQQMKREHGKVSKPDAYKYWAVLLLEGGILTLDYMQIAGLIFVQYSTRFDSSVTKSTIGLSFFSLSFENIIRYPCLFPDLNPQYMNLLLVFLGMLWIILCVHIAGFVLTRTLFSREEKRNHAIMWFYRSKFMFLNYVYPAVSASLLRTFQCINYGDPSDPSLALYALQSDPTVLCDTTSHQQWAIISAILAVVFIPYVPTHVLRILQRHHSLIMLDLDLSRPTDQISIKEHYALRKIEFLHNEFLSRYYLSGPFILLYKLILTSFIPLILVLSNVSVPRQLIVILLWLILGYALLETARPYKIPSLNISSIIATVILCFIVASAIIYGSDIISSADGSGEDLGQVTLSILIIGGFMIATFPIIFAGIVPACRRVKAGGNIYDVHDRLQERQAIVVSLDA